MTPTPAPEDLFRRYRETGDPAALAAVFDRTAPQLLLLAAHVTPDAASAEDLLQETFLQAMANAGQWDAGQPLVPWLGGILRHRAIDLARRLRLRRGAALDDAVASTAPGPAELAADQDVLARVQQGIAQLDAPYRDVLVLRLVHGLPPTGIAHALGRPPATVRVQLQRGLERLRGLLPAALATALAVALGEGRGLAATRAAVLGAGRPARRIAPGAWGLAAVLALVAGVAWWAGRTPAAPVSATAASEPVAAVGAAAPSNGDDAREAGAGGRQAGPDRPAADTAATTLRGRIVGASDRAALPGGQVTLSFGPGRFVTADREFRRWPAPITARAAADGTFAISCEPAAEMRVGLEVTAPGHVPADASWTSLKSGRTFDLGDIALDRGCELQARVVDALGAPVAGVVLEITRESGGVEPGELFTPWSSFETTSGADGRLPPRLLPAPGCYTVAVSRQHPGHRVQHPRELTIDREAVVVHDVVVGPGPREDSLAGRVVDARGLPVPGVAIGVDADFPDFGSAVSAADGSFWITLDLPQSEFELSLPVTERGYRLLEPARKYPRGATDLEVRIEVLPRFDVPIQVVDARTGAPVTSYGLRWELDYWVEELRLKVPPERIYFPAAPEPRPDGRAVLPGLWPGGYRLCVHPATPELATAYLVPFAVAATGAAPLRIELQPFASLRVVVRDEAGAPVAGAEVGLVHDLASGGERAGLFSVEQFARGIGGGRSTAALLATRTTAADGRATFPAPAGETRLRLRVTGPRLAEQWLQLPALPPTGDEVVVTTAARAQIVGRVQPVEGLAWIGPQASARLEDAMVRDEDSDLRLHCPTVFLRTTDDRHAGRAPVLPDGSFRIDAVPPGDLQLGLVVDWCMNPGFYTSETFDLVAVPAVRGGEVRELVVDIGGLRPARLRGVAIVDGAPWTRGSCGIVSSEDEHELFLAVELDGQGRFDRVVRAGRYLPYVTWREEGGNHYLFGGERLDLAPGADVTARFVAERRVLCVEVARADGTAAAAQKLALRCIDFPEAHRWLPTSCQTDAAGVVTFDPAPPGRIEFRLPGDEGARLGEGAAGPGPTTVRVVLPR